MVAPVKRTRRKIVTVPMVGQPVTRTARIEDGATMGATIGTDLFFEDGSIVTLANLATALGVGDTSSSSSLGDLSATIWRLIREVPIYTEGTVSPVWTYTLDGAAIGSVGFAAAANGIASGSLAGDLVLSPADGRVYIPQTGSDDGLVIDADGTNSPTIAFERDSAGVVARIGVAGVAGAIATGSLAGDLVLEPVGTGRIYSTQPVSVRHNSGFTVENEFDPDAGLWLRSSGASALGSNALVSWVENTDGLGAQNGGFDMFMDGSAAADATLFLRRYDSSTTPVVMLQASRQLNQFLFGTNTSSSTPAIAFIDDTDTGITYLTDAGTPRMSFVFGGTGRMYVSGTIIRLALPTRADDGSASAPSYSFNNATSTGVFFASSSLQFSVTGTARVTLSASLLTSTVDTLVQGSVLEVENAAPLILMDETDAAANERQWRIRSVAGVWQLATTTDAGAAGTNAIAIDRTGTTVDEIELNATTIDVNAAVDISGALVIGGAITLSGGLTVAGDTTLNGANLIISSSSPRIRINATGGAVDNRLWDLLTSSEQFRLRAVNDADSVGTVWLQVDRTGTTIDEIELNATALDFNAAMDVSGAVTLGSTLGVTGAATLSSTLSVTAAATFGANVLINNTGPTLRFNETDAAANNRLWDVFVSAERLSWRLVDDAISSGVTYLSVDRTANVADLVTITATELEFDGTTLDVNAAADFSSTLLVAGAVTLSSTLAVTGAASVGGTLKAGTASTNSEVLRLVANDAIGDCYMTFYEEGEGVRKGYVGYGNTTNDTMWIANEKSGEMIYVFTTGTATFRVDATTLDFNGAADISSNLAVGGTLSVTGAATLNSTLTVASTITMNGAAIVLSSTSGPYLRFVDGDATAGARQFRVRGVNTQFIMSIETDAGVLNENFLRATANASSEITLLELMGDEIDLTATTLDFNGNADVSGSLVVGTTLAVTGAVTLSSTLAVTTSATFGGGLHNEYTIAPIVGIAAAGSNAFFTARDSTNDVEAIIGATPASGVILGASTNHDVTIRTNNTARVVIENDGAEIQMDATLFDFNGALDLSGNATIGGQITLSGTGTSTYAGTNRFTDSTGNASPAVSLYSGNPTLHWNETDAAADNKIWYANARAEQFSLGVINDANSLNTQYFVVERTGTTIDSITLTATLVTTPSAVSFGLAGTSASPSVRLESTRPVLAMIETDAAADNKIWTFDVSSEQLTARVVNDAFTLVPAWLTVERTGGAVDSINLATANLSFQIAVVSNIATLLGNNTDSYLAVSSGGAGTAGDVAFRWNNSGNQAWTMGIDRSVGTALLMTPASTIDGATAYFQLGNTGALRLANYGAGTATFDASGNVSSVSDVRHKTAIRAFKRGLAEVVKIRPITYRYNKRSKLEREHRYAGFSAQDVEKQIPEAVGRMADGMRTLQDRAMLAALFNAVRELSGKVEALEDELRRAA